jgi:hypothetical protein
MAPEDRPHSPENQCQQERLAGSLIETLGFEGAVQARQANGWDGVLECVGRPEAEQGNQASHRGRRTAPTVDNARLTKINHL